MCSRQTGIGVWFAHRCGAELRAAWNWNRDNLSAVTFNLPSICFTLKCMLLKRQANTSLLTSLIMLLSLLDCLLMTWTIAMLSVKRSIFLFCSWQPHISKASSIGNNSLIAIWKWRRFFWPLLSKPLFAKYRWKTYRPWCISVETNEIWRIPFFS